MASVHRDCSSLPPCLPASFPSSASLLLPPPAAATPLVYLPMPRSLPTHPTQIRWGKGWGRIHRGCGEILSDAMQATECASGRGNRWESGRDESRGSRDREGQRGMEREEVKGWFERKVEGLQGMDGGGESYN
eukprot:768749-Hanusia_phi.AAC.33